MDRNKIEIEERPAAPCRYMTNLTCSEEPSRRSCSTCMQMYGVPAHVQEQLMGKSRSVYKVDRHTYELVRVDVCEDDDESWRHDFFHERCR